MIVNYLVLSNQWPKVWCELMFKYMSIWNMEESPV